MIIHSESPYYDDYDKDKNYTQILALPGRAEQSREFNQIQTIQRDFVERLGSSIYKSGYVIEGCTLTKQYDENGDFNHTIKISEGKIFLDGLVRYVKESEVAVDGSGIERIMAKVETSIVTEEEDNTLRDPADGSENYGIEGAYREKQVVTFFTLAGDVISSDGNCIYTLLDSEIVNNAETSSASTITDTLAERTYDENGNFKISGLEIKTYFNKDADSILAYVDSGKAYVHGYEVEKDAVSVVHLDKSTQVRQVSSESHTYISKKTQYELSYAPVSKINKVACDILTAETTVQHVLKGGRDDLGNRGDSPVKSIVSVSWVNKQGQTIAYTVSDNSADTTCDCKKYGNQLDWSNAGDTLKPEPDVGSSYTVTYIYTKSYYQGDSSSTDTHVEILNENGRSYLNFVQGGSDAETPVNSSYFYVDYDFTLGRRDLLLLDQSGTISVIQGVPELMGDLITPYNQNKYLLELGYVSITPEGTTSIESNFTFATPINYATVRLTQANLFTMLKRLEALELNQAEMDLDREAEDGEDASDLKGIFTDGFININKSDVNYKSTIGGKEIKFNCCIDYDRNELTTPTEVINMECDVADSKVGIIGNVISAPFKEEVVLSQKNVTGVMKVNPYAVYGPMSAVSITPKVDNWVDTKTVTVYDTKEYAYYNTSYETYSHGYWSTSAIYNLRNYWYSTTESKITGASTTYQTSVASSVSNSVIEYMRVRDITVVGKGFLAGLSNIGCTFNGKSVSLVPLESTIANSSGCATGKVRADLLGNFKAKFTIPSGIPCGSVKVALSGSKDGTTYTGEAVYKAEGTLLTTTVTKTTTVTRNYDVLVVTHNLYKSDPLAQSFVFSEDLTLSSIDLYFATKDASRPVVVQVRNVVNGYPGETVYAETVVDSDKVNIPSVASDTNTKTTVSFSQPVYCEADTYYCFVILSDSNEYSMFYADLGSGLWNNPTTKLTVNPYSEGVMFSSSNSTTWTAHQGADLKFTLNRSRYTGSGEIIFNNVSINSPEIDGLLLDAAYVDYKNAGLTWYFSYLLDSSSANATSSEVYSDWFTLDNFVFRDLQNITKAIRLKAIINIAYNTSPFISASQVSLKCFKDGKNGTYISKALYEGDFEDEYQGLTIKYQAALPTGTTATVYYQDSLEDNTSGTWHEVKVGTNCTLDTVKVDEEFVQYTWNISKVACMTDSSASEYNVRGSKFYKVRIELETRNIYIRPRVKKLVNLFRYSMD